MAIKVPQGDFNVQPTLTRGRATTQVDRDAFGASQIGQAAEGFNKIQNQIQQFAQKEINEMNKIEARNAYYEGIRKKNDLTFGNAGFSKIKGKNALSSIKDYQESYGKELKTIEDSLSNPVQKAMFSEMKGSLASEFNGGMQRHAAQEMRQWETDQFKNGVKILADDTVLNYQDPGKVEKNLFAMGSQIKEYGVRTGKPKEWITQQAKDATSNVYKQVIGRHLQAGNDLKAQALFDEVKSSLNADDTLVLERAVQASSTRGESDRQATKIMTDTKNGYTRSLEEARKIENILVRDATVKEIKVRFQEREHQKQLTDRANSESAFNFVFKNKKLPDEQTMLNLTPDAQKSVIGYVNTVRSGKDVNRNITRFHLLKQMAIYQPDKFQNMDIIGKYGNEFPTKDLELLLKLQSETPKRQGKFYSGIQTEQQILKAAADGLYNAGKIDDKTEPLFKEAVDKEVISWKEAKKQENIPREELKRIVTRLSQDVTVDREGFFSTLISGRFEKEIPGFQLRINQIPAEEKEEIVQALQNARIPILNPSDDQIVRAYLINKAKNEQ
jgi:hypothetical protein